MKAISLFSGVGGFDLGLERAGITTVLQAENDPYCLRVLERHWPQVRRVTDVRDVGGWVSAHPDKEWPRSGIQQQGRGNIGSVEIVFGGFPCQDLSVAGRRAGLGGERSGLWFEFHRVLRELRPRWALVENVPGLLSSADGADLRVVFEGLAELGYGMAWRTWDAQFFLVPQRRRRVFILASHDPEPSLGAERCAQILSLCESCGGNPETSRATGEGVAATVRGRSSSTGVNMPGRGGEDDANLVLAIEDPTGKMSGGSEVGLGVSDGPMYTLGSDPRHVHAVLAVKANTGHTHREDGETYIPDVAYAIAAREAKGVSMLESQTNYVAQHGVRRLTPLECERLQGFPDDWTRWDAEGKELADSHRYRMMGNAVCVPVAEWIGHRLMEVDREMS